MAIEVICVDVAPVYIPKRKKNYQKGFPYLNV
jgi:hypothetical protein